MGPLTEVAGSVWATQGYSAATIDPLARGVSWLLAEDGIPQRIKAAYLTGDQVADLCPARRVAQ